MYGCVGVWGKGGGGEEEGWGGEVKGDTVAYRLKVLKTPAPNALCDPLVSARFARK